MLQAGVKGPSGTRAADRPFFQWMDLEPNTAVWFQQFGTRVPPIHVPRRHLFGEHCEAAVIVNLH